MECSIFNDIPHVVSTGSVQGASHFLQSTLTMLWLAKVSEGFKSGLVVISTSTLFTLTWCVVLCALSCSPLRPVWQCFCFSISKVIKT